MKKMIIVLYIQMDLHENKVIPTINKQFGKENVILTIFKEGCLDNIF